MFVSQEKGATRKTFQKPNILRRKSKAVTLNIQKSNEETSAPLVALNNVGILYPTPTICEQTKGDCREMVQHVQSPKLSVVNVVHNGDRNQDTSQDTGLNNDSITMYQHGAQFDNNETHAGQSLLNVESFLNDATVKQNNNLFNIDGALTAKKMETDHEQKWLDLISDDIKETVTFYYDDSQLSNTHIDKSSDISTGVTAVPLAVSLSETKTSQEVIKAPAQNVPLESINHTSKVFKIKCLEPDCNKSFWTEEKLEKHKKIHKKQKSFPYSVECPVKKHFEDGTMLKCGRTFPVKTELVKHLEEEHSPDDAMYRCSRCGRRFFWAMGMRAHEQGSCGRAFACSWPGCERVFRQPCRLREHARAHSGDRPYPCHFPNCGWAFRSASKLMRHARRHTGERRHECGACGRAFLRKEHLREHAARHHSPRHCCTHEGCEQSFTTLNSMYTHIKKVHSNNEGQKSSSRKAQKNTKTKKDMLITIETHSNNATFETSLQTISESTDIVIKECIDDIVDTKLNITHLSDADIGVASDIDLATDMGVANDIDVATDIDVAIDIGVASTSEEEGRSARTHLTWPLPRNQEQHYILEEEPQVEQSESSESNIYTVRSDLFLHGNVLINEDSEFIISRASNTASADEGSCAGGADGEAGARGGQLDLGLIDSHPTIDLMQEELMYGDAAVDESSFRVFLLNGEELT